MRTLNLRIVGVKSEHAFIRTISIFKKNIMYVLHFREYKNIVTILFLHFFLNIK